MELKNRLLTILAAISKKSRRATQGRFLIVSTTGLGDSLWGTPALRALRTAYPQSYIALLTSSIGKEVFETNPYLDEIFSIENLARTAWKLRKRHIHTAIIFHSSQRTMLPLCKYIGAHTIIGSPSMHKGLDHLLDKVIENKHVHEIIRRLHLVENAGAVVPDKPQLELYITNQDRQHASIYDITNTFCIHPGAQNHFKCWPLKSFATVAKKMQKTFGCSILLMGGPHEKDKLIYLKELIGAGQIITNCSIRTYAAILEKVRLFLTNDTGPMHLGCAVNVQGITLFGPTDPTICGPLHAPNMHVLQTKPTCTPCVRKKCNDPFCLMEISPDAVYTLACTLWQKNN